MLVTLDLFDIKNDRHENILSYNFCHSQVTYRAKYKISNLYKSVSKVKSYIEKVHTFFGQPSYLTLIQHSLAPVLASNCLFYL